MTDRPAVLNQRFGLAPHLRFAAGPGNLTVAEIANDHAVARVALHGGHVLSFHPHGQQPILWVSRHSQYVAGTAIRGGIPVCWPWFGAHPTEPRSWNIRLTLMVMAVAFSIAVAVLEYVGVIRDLGVILSIVGLALAVAFGISGSSQRTVELIRFDLRGVRRDLARFGDGLGGLRVDLGGLRDATSGGFARMNRGLTEIAALLRERLPRP